MKRKYILWLCILLLVIGAVMTFTMGGRKKNKQGFGLFSWSEDIFEEEELETFIDCALQAQVSEVYQEFPMDYLETGKAGLFIHALQKEGIQVYGLTGDAQWAYDENGRDIIDYLDKIAAYNQSQKEINQISSVLVDVEPYLLDEWDQGEAAREKLMDTFCDGMEKAYAYAKSKGITFWICIPTFYDSTSPDILERLVVEGCDGLAVMNYNRTDEYGQMEKEVNLVRQYDKGIVCIYELQEAGNHDLEEINTYAGEGLEAVWESSEALKNEFQYAKLKFAYHYYIPLKTMLLENTV